MPSTLGKNLNLCFTKIKLPLASQSTAMNQIPTPPPNHPHNHHSHPFPTTNTTSTSILIKNFNSLYEYTFDSTTSKSLTQSPSSLSTSSSISETAPAVADFATAFASQRFFFSTPGRSNSIIESTSPSTAGGGAAADAATLELDHTLFNNSVAVPTFSPDPYTDFRRSMQEMVEARELMDVKKSNWEFLHELLLCYLALNPKSTHKFIIGAFSDLLVSLMPPHSDSDGLQENDFVAAAAAAAAASVCEISRQCT